MNKRILTLIAVVALFAGLTAAPAAAQAVNSLKAVSFQKTDKGVDVTIAIDGEFLYQALPLSNPTRLAIDLSPLARIDAQPFLEINQAGVASVRIGQYSAMIVRVVLDFSGALPGYEIAKTDAGLLVHISTEAKPAEKPAVVAPPVREQPVRVQPVVQEKPAESIAETGTGEGRTGFANTMIGIDTSSYQIPDSNFTRIYGTDVPMIFGFSLSRKLIQVEGFSLDVEGSLRFYSKTGASTLSQEATTFKINPMWSLAGRLNYEWKYFQFFAGGGIDWYSYSETSTIANTTGKANGSHFTAGIYLIPPVLDSMLRVKIYYKFTKVTALSNGISVELGGNEYGVGLSFGFNFLKQGVLSF
jgi:hypothetical protein